MVRVLLVLLALLVDRSAALLAPRSTPGGGACIRHRGRRLCHRGPLKLLATDQVDGIRSMRASALKKLLENERIPVKGLFDKEDLARALIEHETGLAKQCSSGRLVRISFPNSQKQYYGLEVALGSNKLRFLLDSGATISLLNKSTQLRLGLPSQAHLSYTHSFGGADPTGATSPLSSERVALEGAQFLGRRFSIQCSLVDNAAALPTGCDGLLGLDFLGALGLDLLLDLPRGEVRVGPRSCLVPPSARAMWEELPMRRMPSGLAVVQAALSMPSASPSGGEIECSAMIDLGSLYTIANAKAADSLYGAGALKKLPLSGAVVAGIDARPLELHSMALAALRLGRSQLAVPPVPTRAAGTSGFVKGVYAADVPGLTAVGLNGGPALIVGLDVLEQLQVLLTVSGGLLIRPPI
jgi:predicted aspartyl protease